MGDSLKLGGRHVWAESLEIQIAAALDVSPHRCLVVPAPGAVSDTVAIVIEAPHRDWADAVLALVRSEVGTSVEIMLYAAEPRTILRTTSGKPRRREMWRQLGSPGTIDQDWSSSLAFWGALPSGTQTALAASLFPKIEAAKTA